jgi:hypothetical protein
MFVMALNLLLLKQAAMNLISRSDFFKIILKQATLCIRDTSLRGGGDQGEFVA